MTWKTWRRNVLGSSELRIETFVPELAEFTSDVEDGSWHVKYSILLWNVWLDDKRVCKLVVMNFFSLSLDSTSLVFASKHPHCHWLFQLLALPFTPPLRLSRHTIRYFARDEHLCPPGRRKAVVCTWEGSQEPGIPSEDA